MEGDFETGYSFWRVQLEARGDKDGKKHFVHRYLFAPSGVRLRHFERWARIQRTVVDGNVH